ncbi:MAG: carbon storage regulator [Pirellulaceae bacterium]
MRFENSESLGRFNGVNDKRSIYQAKENAMLVLTRKAKQQIRLGDDIVVTVLQVKGNAIRLGIEAPRETRVVRGELQFFAEEPKKADKPMQDDCKAPSSKSATSSASKSIAQSATSDHGPAGSHAGQIRVCGPTRLKIQPKEGTTERFPATMQRSGTNVPEGRPLKRFMPKTMIETVGNVSV